MTTINSAEVLRGIWDRYVADVREAKGCTVVLSMREVAHRLNLDQSALARWTSVEAPLSRRIPLKHVPALAEFLMMTGPERDALMEARLSEMHDEDEVVVACSWMLETLQPYIQPPLDADEQHVLAAFREARENYPRGLYPGGDAALQSLMKQHLQTAEQLYLEEESVEPEVAVGPKPSAEDWASQQDWVRKVRDNKKQHFLAEYTRIRQKYRPKIRCI